MVKPGRQNYPHSRSIFAWCQALNETPAEVDADVTCTCEGFSACREQFLRSAVTFAMEKSFTDNNIF